MSLAEDLTNVIRGEVRNDDETLRHYSTDASAFRIKPEVVVFPKDSEDVQKLVRYVQDLADEHPEDHPSLTARSAGTCMTGGPLNTSIIVDVNRHMNEIKDVGEDYVTFEPGVFYRDLEKETKQHGLIFPSYSASRDIASAGGYLANNAGGERTLEYGKTEDWVREMKVVLRDGNEYTFGTVTREEFEAKKQQDDLEGQIYREVEQLLTDQHDTIQEAEPQVTKNSTGYPVWNVWDKESDTFDMAQLFVGSQGTLGIITEGTLGLVPTNEHSRMYVAYLQNIDHVADIVNTMLEFEPTAIESYDNKTLKLALKYAPQMAKLISKEESLLHFGWQMLPDFWIIAKHFRLPALVIMAEFRGDNPDELDTKVQRLDEAMQQYDADTHIPSDEKSARKYWVIRRQSFNLLRKKIEDKQTVPFIDDIIVNPAQMPEFLPRLNKILDDYPQLIYTVAGHAGNGNFHIIPLMDLEDEEQRELIPKISERVYDLVLEYNGSLSAEHNDGLIRGPYLKKMYGEEMFSVFEQLHQIFDPYNIFNPHKKTDSDLEWSMDHLKKSNVHHV